MDKLGCLGLRILDSSRWLGLRFLFEVSGPCLNIVHFGKRLLLFRSRVFSVQSPKGPYLTWSTAEFCNPLREVVHGRQLRTSKRMAAMCTIYRRCLGLQFKLKQLIRSSGSQLPMPPIARRLSLKACPCASEEQVDEDEVVLEGEPLELRRRLWAASECISIHQRIPNLIAT